MEWIATLGPRPRRTWKSTQRHTGCTENRFRRTIGHIAADIQWAALCPNRVFSARNVCRRSDIQPSGPMSEELLWEVGLPSNRRPARISGLVESGMGAVAWGLWPSPRFPSLLIGRVGDWRAGLGRSLCSLLPRPFGCEVSQQFDRAYVSSPRHVERSVRISRTTLTCLLRLKGYGTYPAGATFGCGQRT